MYIVLQNVYFNMEHSPRQEDDFNLLSNDIPLSGSPDSMDGWDSEDTAIMGKNFNMVNDMYNLIKVVDLGKGKLLSKSVICFN